MTFRTANHYLHGKLGLDAERTRTSLMYGKPTVAELLEAGIRTLAPADRSHPLQLSWLKSSTARLIQAQRVRAMLEAAEIPRGQTPAWMLAARVPVAAWIGWTGCLSQVVISARLTQDDASLGGRLQVRSMKNGRVMTLRGGIYANTISGVIELSGRPICLYVDEPVPRLVLKRTALPETVLASINRAEDCCNRGRRLGDIIDHHFVAAYDPTVTCIANVDGDVEIALDAAYSTLAPVPAIAMRTVPPDADPGRPWELTADEARTLRSWKPATVTPP